MAASSEIHIGQAIEQRLKETGMTKAKFAKRIHCTRQNVYSIFERKELGATLLRKISEILDCNFFALQNDYNQTIVVLIANKHELHKLQSNKNLQILSAYELSNNNDVIVK